MGLQVSLTALMRLSIIRQAQLTKNINKKRTLAEESGS